MAIKLFIDIARALVHLHLRGIIHRTFAGLVCGLVAEMTPPFSISGDIAARNVLIENGQTAVLADFGLALVVDPYYRCTWEIPGNFIQYPILQLVRFLMSPLSFTALPFLFKGP